MYRRPRLLLACTLALSCLSCASNLPKDETRAVTRDSARNEQGASLLSGGYLKIYALEFAATASADGYPHGAFSISDTPAAEGPSAAYVYQVELNRDEGLMILTLELIGADGGLELESWRSEGAPQGAVDDALVLRWHERAASVADEEAQR